MPSTSAPAAPTTTVAEAEARILIQDSFERYPNIDKTFLNNQIVSITKEQAEKDFRMAEFYERTGHPGAAVWQYDLVIRRYHGMEPYATDAIKRRADILNKMQTQGLAEPTPPMPHNQGPQLEPLPAPCAAVGLEAGTLTDGKRQNPASPTRKARTSGMVPEPMPLVLASHVELASGAMLSRLLVNVSGSMRRWAAKA